MITWIVTTLLTSLAAILIAAPFIWRYAARHSTQEAPVQPNGVTTKSVSEQLKPSRSRVAVTAGLVIYSCVAIFMLGRGQELPAGRSTSLSSSPQLFPQTRSSPDQAIEQLQKFASGSSDTKMPPTPASGLPPVDELIERLTARLQKNPNDISGWRTLGWSQFNLQHYNDAAAVYAKAIELFPNVADLHSLRGEALVQAASGTVTPEAKQAFNEALKIDSKDIRARFFDGLAKSQAGDKTSAIDVWIEVSNEAAANEPMMPLLSQRIAELAAQLNIDVNKRLKRPIAALTKIPSVQPKDRDIAATANISSEQPKSRDIAGTANTQTNPRPDDSRPASGSDDQTAMIAGMVERLTTRLNQSPRDVDGWIMLIRSKQVLNDPQAARDAFSRALKIFDERSPERDRLVAAAKELGLSP